VATGRHGIPEFRDLAEANTILRVQVGSGVHGIAIEGTDDRDEMGVCVEPQDYVFGLLPLGVPERFEQYEHHTAWEREGGLKNRSGPGDLDVTVYSLRKFLRLALNGNPAIIGTFFTPPREIISCNGLGLRLLELAPLIVSKEAGPKYLGYLKAQRRSMESGNGKGRDVTRKELVGRYGFDTKFAGHMIRLGLQGAELLETGRITLPMRAHERGIVRSVRTGAFTMQACLDFAGDLEARVRRAMEASALPEHPDREAVNRWLVQAYLEHWGLAPDSDPGAMMRSWE
jgi:hypothetical protein